MYEKKKLFRKDMFTNHFVLIVGRDAVFTINFKQLLQEKISIRIVDPRGSVVPHRENEIQTGISRYFHCFNTIVRKKYFKSLELLRMVI